MLGLDAEWAHRNPYTMGVVPEFSPKGRICLLWNYRKKAERRKEGWRYACTPGLMSTGRVKFESWAQGRLDICHLGDFNENNLATFELATPSEVAQRLNFGLAFGRTREFESRSSHPDFGSPWFPEIAPGECRDGSSTRAMADSFPNLSSSGAVLHRQLLYFIIKPNYLPELVTHKCTADGEGDTAARSVRRQPGIFIEMPPFDKLQRRADMTSGASSHFSTCVSIPRARDPSTLARTTRPFFISIIEVWRERERLGRRKGGVGLDQEGCGIGQSVLGSRPVDEVLMPRTSTTHANMLECRSGTNTWQVMRQSTARIICTFSSSSARNSQPDASGQSAKGCPLHASCGLTCRTTFYWWKCKPASNTGYSTQLTSAYFATVHLTPLGYRLFTAGAFFDGPDLTRRDNKRSSRQTNATSRVWSGTRAPRRWPRSLLVHRVVFCRQPQSMSDNDNDCRLADGIASLSGRSDMPAGTDGKVAWVERQMSTDANVMPAIDNWRRVGYEDAIGISTSRCDSAPCDLQQTATCCTPTSAGCFIAACVEANYLSVVELLACSPPTKTNRAQTPAGSLPDFRIWKSCRTMPLFGGFLGELPFPPPFHSGAVPFSPQSPSSAFKTSLLRAAQISSLTHSFCKQAIATCKETITESRDTWSEVTLAELWGSSQWIQRKCSKIHRAVEFNLRRPRVDAIPQHILARAFHNFWCRLRTPTSRSMAATSSTYSRGKTGPTASPTNGIVHHDSHMRKSGVTRPGIEPGSPWWEASSLTAQSPWSLHPVQQVDRQLSAVGMEGLVKQPARLRRTTAAHAGKMATLARNMLGTPLVNQRPVTNTSASSPANREYFAACSDQSQAWPPSRASRVADVMRTATIFPLCVLGRCLFKTIGATVAERLARSPAKANRVQSPAGSPDFRKLESYRPLVGGFSRGSPVLPAPSFRRCSVFTSITHVGSQDPHC
ncbi:hypothetical protein PR048_017611 [Dryococelus australis]|uniref:Uncharacterized protein n=1 Tax=Dryococelus australis TaxID=614101 RepID=A0ABQ9HAK5_9NEOP|nr:hypothetical protein PR048_017611 [Dryococelus australis]